VTIHETARLKYASSPGPAAWPHAKEPPGTQRGLTRVEQLPFFDIRRDRVGRWYWSRDDAEVVSVSIVRDGRDLTDGHLVEELNALHLMRCFDPALGDLAAVDAHALVRPDRDARRRRGIVATRR
jgi:hypothetical protein